MAWTQLQDIPFRNPKSHNHGDTLKEGGTPVVARAHLQDIPLKHIESHTHGVTLKEGGAPRSGMDSATRHTFQKS